MGLESQEPTFQERRLSFHENLNISTDTSADEGYASEVFPSPCISPKVDLCFSVTEDGISQQVRLNVSNQLKILGLTNIDAVFSEYESILQYINELRNNPTSDKIIPLIDELRTATLKFNETVIDTTSNIIWIDRNINKPGADKERLASQRKEKLKKLTSSIETYQTELKEQLRKFENSSLTDIIKEYLKESTTLDDFISRINFYVNSYGVATLDKIGKEKNVVDDPLHTRYYENYLNILLLKETSPPSELKRHAELFLYLAVVNYVNAIRKEYATAARKTKQGDSTTKFDTSSKNESLFNQAIALYIILRKAIEPSDTDSDLKQQIPEYILKIIKELESNNWKTPIWLVAAVMAAGIFGTSTYFSTPLFNNGKEIEDGEESPTDHEPGTETADGLFSDDLSDQALVASVSAMIIASATSNFAIYGDSVFQILNFHLRNFVTLLQFWKKGVLYNTDSSIVEVSCETKILILLKILGYSISMIALLIFAFTGAIGAIGALVGTLFFFSFMLSGRFNNDYYVNKIPSQMFEKVKDLFSFSKSKACFLSWIHLLAFTSAAFISLNVGYTMFCKIFILGPLSMAVVAAGATLLPFLLSIGFLTLAIALMHVQVTNKWLLLAKYLLIALLIAVSILSAACLAANLGPAALIVLAATFVGVMAGLVIYKMLTNAICCIGKTYESLKKVTEGRPWMTSIIVTATTFVLMGLLVVFNALAQSFISMDGLSDEDVFTVISFVTEGFVLFLCNFFNSLILGMRSWAGLISTFFPTIINTIEVSDFMLNWNSYLKENPNSYFTFYLVTACIFVPAAALTSLYAAVRTLDSIINFAVWFGINSLNWSFSNINDKLITDKNSEQNPGQTIIALQKTGLFIVKICTTLFSVALIAISLPLSAGYVITKPINFLMSQIFEWAGIKQKSSATPKTKPAEHTGPLKRLTRGFDSFVEKTNFSTPTTTHMLDKLMCPVAPVPKNINTSVLAT